MAFGSVNISGGSVINSIQSGEVSLSISGRSTIVNINQVDLSKSIILIQVRSGTNKGNETFARASFASSTSLEFYRYHYSGNTYVSWQVIEFKDVKSLQYGDTTVTNGANVAINAVDLNKSFVVSSEYWTADYLTQKTVARLVDSTTVQLQQNGGANASYVHWFVVEFN